MSDDTKPDLTTLTVQLLSAYVSNNAVPNSDLADLIRTTKAALAGEEKPEVVAEPEPEHIPAVSVRSSLASREHILSMIDGKPYKTLRRHLSTHGLTPEEYRIRYNLAQDYPMVAPAYSERRRKVAKELGLGRKRQAESATAAATVASEGVSSQPSSRRAAAPKNRSALKSQKRDGSDRAGRGRSKPSTNDNPTS